jgi:hypothetical protein
MGEISPLGDFFFKLKKKTTGFWGVQFAIFLKN